MFLSKISLNLSNRNTIEALSSPSKIHGAIENCFLQPRKRNLWRVDRLRDEYCILILSEDKPEFSKFNLQFEPYSVATKPYDSLLNRISTSDEWHFRITANPTKSLSNNTKQRGKVVAHTTIGYQKKWLMEKSIKNGFTITEDTFDVVQSGWKHFYKRDNKTNRRVSILSVTYEGVLTISNVESFKEALINGIGRGKAYGMGLLTIAK